MRDLAFARVFIVATIGGAIGVGLGVWITVAQRSFTDSTTRWIAGSMLAVVGILVGGFIGAMTNCGREPPFTGSPELVLLPRLHG